MPPGPQGFWLTDPAFRDRLHTATLTMLDMVEGVLYDDFTLTEAIDGARYHATDMLNIPTEYGILVEAEAAAQIVQAASLTAGSPFGPAVGQALARIEAMPVEDQQRLVRAAARRYSITAPTRRPARTPQTPAASPVPPQRRTR